MKKLLALVFVIFLSCSEKEIILQKQEVLYRYYPKDKNYSVEIISTLSSECKNLDKFYILPEKDTLFLSVDDIKGEDINLHIILPNREFNYNDSLFIKKISDLEIRNINNDIKIKKARDYTIESRIYMWEGGVFGGIE